MTDDLHLGSQPRSRRHLSHTPDDEADRYSHLVERRRTPEFDAKHMTPPDEDDDGEPGGVALLVLAILLSWGLAYALFVAARAAWRLT